MSDDEALARALEAKKWLAEGGFKQISEAAHETEWLKSLLTESRKLPKTKRITG